MSEPVGLPSHNAIAGTPGFRVTARKIKLRKRVLVEPGSYRGGDA